MPLGKTTIEKMTEMMRTCMFPFAAGFGYMHKKGWTPYVYNMDGIQEDVRHEHFKATFFVTTALTFTVMTAVAGALGFKNIHDTEEKGWQGLDEVYHRLAAVVVLGVIALVTGVVAALIHKGVNEVKHRVNESKDNEYSRVETFKTSTHPENTYVADKGEGIALLRPTDKEGGMTHDKWNVANLVSPKTPTKTFGWIATLGVLAMVMYFSVKPEDFKQLADTEIVHDTAVVLFGLTTGAGAGGLFTLGHMARSSLQNRFGSTERAVYQEIPNNVDHDFRGRQDPSNSQEFFANPSDKPKFGALEKANSEFLYDADDQQKQVFDQ